MLEDVMVEVRASTVLRPTTMDLEPILKLVVGFRLRKSRKANRFPLWLNDPSGFLQEPFLPYRLPEGIALTEETVRPLRITQFGIGTVFSQVCVTSWTPFINKHGRFGSLSLHRPNKIGKYYFTLIGR